MTQFAAVYAGKHAEPSSALSRASRTLNPFPGASTLGNGFFVGCNMTGRPSVPVEIRLHARLEIVTESGCWIWVGACDYDGYGLIGTGDGTKTKRVHRLAYELYRGPIPAYMTLDHLCRVRCCANPWHCEIVSNKTNILRGYSDPAINARKTHCRNGHPYTMKTKFGRRHCGIC